MSLEEEKMAKEKYPSTFSRQMEAIDRFHCHAIKK